MKPYLTLSAVLLCFGWSGACFAQSQPQSLAAVAQQSKTGKKEVIKLTDDTLPFARTQEDTDSGEAQDSKEAENSAPPASSESSTSPATASHDSGKAAAKAQKSDVKKLEDELRSYRQQEQTWSSSASNYEEKLAKEPSEFRRNTYREAMENDRQNVDYFRQKITDTESQLQKARENQKKQKPSGDQQEGRDNSSASPLP